MRKRGRPRAARAKSRQVHFWVDHGLLEDFLDAAGRCGDPGPDAHRNALRCYLDRNAEDGASIVLNTELVTRGGVLTLRAFSRGEAELVVTLSGSQVAEILEGVAGAGGWAGLGDWVTRMLGRRH